MVIFGSDGTGYQFCLFLLFTEDGEKVEVDEIQPLKTYANGNYGDLMKFLSKQTGKPNPNVQKLFFIMEEMQSIAYKSCDNSIMC
jgi:hypothetical protein